MLPTSYRHRRLLSLPIVATALLLGSGIVRAGGGDVTTPAPSQAALPDTRMALEEASAGGSVWLVLAAGAAGATVLLVRKRGRRSTR